MKKSILLITCVILLTACSAPVLNTQNMPTHPDLLIVMETGACFGTCPMYSLTIHANGAVNYEGLKFVKIEGNRSSRISSDQIQELVSAIENANFFALEDQYVTNATDLPSITLSITMDGREKSIWHYGLLNCDGELDGAPKELCELENKIDEVTNSAQWVE
jgi:hypothetical protein